MKITSRRKDPSKKIAETIAETIAEKIITHAPPQVPEELS
jgi:hypothetical protein